MPVFEVRPLITVGNNRDGWTVERMSDDTSDIYIRPLRVNEVGILDTLARKHLRRARHRYGVIPIHATDEIYEVFDVENNRPILQLARYGLPSTAYRGATSRWKLLWTGTIRRRSSSGPFAVLDFERDPNGAERLMEEYDLDIEILARGAPGDEILLVEVGPSSHPDGLEGSQADTFEFGTGARGDGGVAAWLDPRHAIIPFMGLDSWPREFDWRTTPFKFGFDPVSGEPLRFDPTQMAEAILSVELYRRKLFRSGEPIIPQKLLRELAVPCFIEQDGRACEVLFDALFEGGYLTDVDHSKPRGAR